MLSYENILEQVNGGINTNVGEKHHWKATADLKADKTGRLVPKGHIITGGTDTERNKKVLDPKTVNKSGAVAVKQQKAKARRRKMTDDVDAKNDDDEKQEMISFLDFHNAVQENLNIHSLVENFVEDFNSKNDGKMFWQPIGEHSACIRFRDGQKLLEFLDVEDAEEVEGYYQVDDAVFSISEIDFKGDKIYEALIFQGNLDNIDEESMKDIEKVLRQELDGHKANKNPAMKKANQGLTGKTTPVKKGTLYRGATPHKKALDYADKLENPKT